MTDRIEGLFSSPADEVDELLGWPTPADEEVDSGWLDPSNPSDLVELIAARNSPEDLEKLVTYAASFAHGLTRAAYRSPHSQNEATMALRIAFGLRTPTGEPKQAPIPEQQLDPSAPTTLESAPEEGEQ